MVVLGRSGTGKTTCCLYRMVQEFLFHKEQDQDPPLRQLFVTKNKLLCQKYKSQFERLITYFSDDSFCGLTDSKESTIGHFNKLNCPLFLSWDDFLKLIDLSLYDDYLDRDANSELRNDSEYDSECSFLYDSEPTDKRLPNRHIYECLTKFGTKITAFKFESNIWKDEIRFKHGLNSAELVWMEIKSFIKGFRPTGALSYDEYCALPSKIAPNFADFRQEVYKVYEQYRRYCDRMERFDKSKPVYDECDLVIKIYQELKQHHKSYNWLFDSLYVDEVQDFTQSEVLILIQSCKSTKCNIFLTGDTAQTVMRDVSFRFKDLKTSFFTSEDICEDKAPPIHELTVNYRSHSGILKLAGHILSLLEKKFPNSVDRVPRDNGMFPGPKPKFIMSCDQNILKRIIGTDVQIPSESPFGHNQAVIVKTEESKRLLPFDENDVQVFSVYESKGLEFDDVLLYNFFSQVIIMYTYITATYLLL